MNNMKLVDLIPLQEIDFASQKGFDAYNKAHKLRPDTKVTIAGKTTTAGKAAQAKGTSVFGGANDKSITDIKTDKQVDASTVSKSILSNLRVKDSNDVVNKDADELQKRLSKGQNGVYTRTSPHGGVMTFKDGAKFDIFRPHDAHKTKSTIIYTSKK